PTSTAFTSMSPPPPLTTLFPYTTLFRSTHQHKSVIGLRQEAGNFPLRIGWFNAVAELSQGLGALPVRRRHGDASELVDQRFSGRSESTRLNSSHVKISYAVFCLKKKKSQ